MSELDELLVALTCRFSLDVFTNIQQDYAAAAQDATSDLELEELRWSFRALAFSTGGRARAFVGPVADRDFREGLRCPDQLPQLHCPG